MARFQPSLAFWPPPQFLGESQKGFAAWIVGRHASLHDKVGRDTAIRRIIDNHHDKNGRTIEPAKPKGR